MNRKNLVLAAVAAAVCLDTLIYGIIIPILPAYSASLGASPWQIGVIFAAYSAALLAGTIPLGILSDRYGRKKIMFCGLLSLSLSTIGFALANSIMLLVVTRLMQGLAAAATWTAGPALVADLFSPEERGAKMGVLSAANGFGFLVGPAAGGVLYQWGGYSLPFVLCTVLAVLIGLLVLMVIPGHPSAVGRVANGQSLRQVLGNRGVLTGSAVILLGSIGFGFIDPLLPGYFTQKFNITPSTIGFLFAVISLCHIAAAPLVGRLSDRVGRLKLIRLGLIATALAVPLLAPAGNLLLTAAVMGLLGITFSLLLTPSMPLMADAVMPTEDNSHDAGYGAAFGIYNTAFSLGYLIGPLAGGGWLEFFSLPSLLVAYSVFLLLVGLPALTAGSRSLQAD
ncbi:MFS transporter [Desulforamulus hydrothermalis]|uniref:Major facilitator superfamily MFS_1 n=1 Tax=Desulforamulus hydrothermalis Lam5 = DSM 18033 TaxID=1121428 RepID=K8E0Y2_9FIRM|nr:MFS transporter [Desulforamulus hydrothermalis]CCO09319.1 Major facilitator superfamily MFS_1 [Desulforamulus hydrothermalis Lam5 = DSM 18033]SHH04234.1 Multidrug resistance protein [Desulforamulus hydrothermalis Lam5 = DSM 18033]